MFEYFKAYFLLLFNNKIIEHQTLIKTRLDKTFHISKLLQRAFPLRRTHTPQTDNGITVQTNAISHLIDKKAANGESLEDVKTVLTKYAYAQASGKDVYNPCESVHKN